MNTNLRFTINWGKGVTLLFCLAFALVASLATASAAQPPRAHPALLKFAKQRPNDKIRVIVQQFSKEKLSEQEQGAHGLKVGKQLGIINGFAAEMPLNKVEALAKHNKVRWISIDAPVRSSGTVGYYTYRDEFSSLAYNGSNGTQNWKDGWTEIGESDGTGSGNVRVVASSHCAADNCLRIGCGSIVGDGASRKVDLSGATLATLSFGSKVEGGYGLGTVGLQVSANGGSSWTTLKIYGLSSTGGLVQETFDITAYIASNTMIRLYGAGIASGYLYIDNAQIEYMRLANTYVKEIQADQVWKELAKEPGQDITVAVVDSGINGQHSDFTNGTSSRVGYSINWSSSSTNTADENGHGTHMAGIIGGIGTMSSGARMGVAPKVNLLNVKVSDAQGRALTSDVVNALQWVYNNRATYNIKVVNLSMNSTVPESYHTSPLSAAVEVLWFSKIVVVVSAGNNGTGTGAVTLYPPANDPFVITVGSVDDKGTNSPADDVTPAYSAYGTTESGFAKPDLVTPGLGIISTLASTSSYAYVNYPNNRVDANYFRMSGTSPSAAVVSGAVALLLQDEPGLTPDQVKYRLKATANKSWSGYNATTAGAGILDIRAAVQGTTTQSANTGIAASQLLFSGANPAVWDSVNWDSVNWDSVNWDSVNWDSVNWDSVNWDSWRP
jgi:serine protease AprX